jgi:hypothetical protein
MQPTTTTTDNNTKKLIVVLLLLIIGMIFWRWSMYYRYGHVQRMDMRHGSEKMMQKGEPMSDVQIEEVLSAGAETDESTNADLKEIDVEFR